MESYCRLTAIWGQVVQDRIEPGFVAPNMLHSHTKALQVALFSIVSHIAVALFPRTQELYYGRVSARRLARTAAGSLDAHGNVYAPLKWLAQEPSEQTRVFDAPEPVTSAVYLP